MNFTPFGTPFTGLHQFTTSTLVSATGINSTQSPAATITTIQPQIQQSDQQNQQDLNRYQNTNSSINMTHFSQPLVATTTATIPAKFRIEESVDNKYNGHIITTQQQYTTIPYAVTTEPSTVEDKRLIAAAISYPQTITTTSAIGQIHTQPQEISQDLCNAILQGQQIDTKRVVLQNPNWQTITPNSTVADYLSHLPANTLPLSLHQFLKYSAENIKKEPTNVIQTGQTINLNTIGTITIPQHQIQHTQLQQTQPQILQQTQQVQVPQQQQPQPQTLITCQPITTSAINATNISQNTTNPILSAIPPTITITTTTVKTERPKKKRRKTLKERKPKPKPGEIRLTTALDGSLLYMCPECQVAYPERALLEVHLVGHNLERRFICEICNAALKRKDHLTRHKQSHNPDRPFICTVCLKAFKRKEQLSLHFVIHSGEKRHVCMECGKGFYRKDHLRKHARSHIARRVKAELTLQQGGNPPVAGLSQQQQVITTAVQQVLTATTPGQQQHQQQHQVITQQLNNVQQQNQQIHQIQIQQPQQNNHQQQHQQPVEILGQ